MKDYIKRSTSLHKVPIYTKIGVVFMTICGMVYLFKPGMFREGFFPLAVGVVLLLTSMINILRKLHYDMVTLLVGIYFCIEGIHTFFTLEIPYRHVITIVLLVPVVLLSARSLIKS